TKPFRVSDLNSAVLRLEGGGRATGAEAAESGTGTFPVLDPGRFADLEGMDEEIRSLFDHYLEDAAGLLREVISGLASGEMEELTSAAHRLAGGSFSVGAVEMGTLCRDLERRVRNRESLPEAQVLEAAFERVRRAMEG
ncbi:MAG: Hpt domain-containing protein, partial [Alphaproteobacteria bacterium]